MPSFAAALREAALSRDGQEDEEVAGVLPVHS